MYISSGRNLISAIIIITGTVDCTHIDKVAHSHHSKDLPNWRCYIVMNRK